MSNVEELEKKLKTAKKKEADSQWNSIVDKYTKLGEYLKGKDIIQYYMRYSWSVIRVTDYKINHDTSSGFYGQWDKARWFELHGERLYMGSKEWKRTYCTDGAIKEEDILKGFADITIQPHEKCIQIPLNPKERWGTRWKKVIELGDLNNEQVILELGKDVYDKRDYNKASNNLANFQTFLHLAPDGMYDELKEHYLKKAKLAHELYLKYKEDRLIDSKKIEWDKIFK